MISKQKYDISVLTPTGTIELVVRWDGYSGPKDMLSGITEIHTANFISNSDKIVLYCGTDMQWGIHIGTTYHCVLNISDIQQQLTGNGMPWKFCHSLPPQN